MMGPMKSALMSWSGSKLCFTSGSKLTQLMNQRPLLSAAPLTMITLSTRNAHTQDVTKNMQYITKDKCNVKVNSKTMELDKPIEKPLCVMINWLLARQKHIMKYASIYLNEGFDVLSVSVTPWQLMWPMKGSQLVALDMLNFMANNKSYSPITIHGFSVAGYMWGELSMHALQDKPKYEPVFDRIAAQVWDSAVDISEITIGVPAAIFPKNNVMRKGLESYMTYHLKHFHSVATVHYMRSSQMFHLNPCRAPALFLLSKSDPVGAEHTNKKVHDSWVELGTKTTWKCWDKSPHVQHFTKHREEYLNAVYEHLTAASVISQSDKARVRL